MVECMTEGMDKTTCINDANGPKPKTFPKAFCKTGIDTEGLTTVIQKTAQNMAIAKTAT